ncbi:MAG: DUF1822 family protein [Cyanobacteria bacterium P01_A01_bin.123]
MVFNLDRFNPTQLSLEITPDLQDQAWAQSRMLATPQSQWQGYLNSLCLQTLLPWIQTEQAPMAQSIVPSAALPSFWELVNGSAIALGSQRLVLIPTEAIDNDELRVPQEWIDISTWRGDYYWGVQVEPDAGWVQVFGFATHQQLKQAGDYDWRDRTYALSELDLIADLSVLWTARQAQAPIVTQAECPPLAHLTTPQAHQLMQRLGDTDLQQPRLSIPFTQWAALIAHGGWRQQLAEQRWGLTAQRQVSDWLVVGIRQLASQFGWQQIDWQAAPAVGRGGTTDAPTAGFSRQLSVEQVPYELRILPIDAATNSWRFELRCLVPGRPLPAGLQLYLLTEDLQPFEGNEEVAEQPVEQLSIEVVLASGEGLVWGMVPTPDQYDVEILRF